MLRLVGLAVLVVILASCVDNRANAIDFCERHRDLIAEERDGESLTKDEAKDIKRDIEKSMRDAEDATRPVRRAARDLLGAYDDVGRLDDDDDRDDVAEVEAELQVAREDLRAACVGFIDVDSDRVTS